MIVRNVVFGLALACAGLVTGTSGAMAAGCEGISNPFAYNECLAKQGPQRSTSRARRSRGGNPEATVRGRARYNPSADDRNSSVRISRTRGRSSAVIDPWGSIKRTFTPGPKKRRR